MSPLSRNATTALAIPVAALLLAAGVIGCGTSKRERPTSAATAATTTTAPTTTTAMTTTTTTTTTTTLPGVGRPQVTVGDKNFTEQFLLGHLYQQALAAEGFTVALNPNIGATEITIQALQSGSLDMYPEYLDTWNTTVAGIRRSFSTLAAAHQAGQRYAVAHGLRLLDPTPFSDTDAIAVTQAYASEHALGTLGDLRTVAGMLTLGAPPEFRQSPAGLPAIERAYGFVPAAFKPVELGAQYQALDQGLVQAAYATTTDGQLATGGYTLLADPLGVFGSGNIVPVVPAKVLLAEGPAFAATIDRVGALLSTTVMRELNAAVDLYHQDPAAVAKQFLQSHGMVPATAS